jgi:glycosyltransferase involved in cell wall biosynthesis
VLPFRNAVDTLADCLDSIQAQTLQDYEVLLVNDGSDDASAQLVRSRAKEDTRLRLIEPGRIGLVPALNLGISLSRADLIGRMDADDIMHRERLRIQCEFLRSRPEISLVACKVELFPPGHIRAGYREYVRWQNECLDPADIAGNLFVESPLAHPSVMLRRSALDAVGGYREGPFPEDYDLWLRMHEGGLRMAKVPEVLLYWRERPDRTSRVDPRYHAQAFDRLRAQYLARDRRIRSCKEIVIWGAGRATRKRVRLLLKEGVRPGAWVDVDPRKIGRTIAGLSVHAPEWLDRKERPFVLSYVTNHGAREKICAALEQWGYRRGVNYLCVG